MVVHQSLVCIYIYIYIYKWAYRTRAFVSPAPPPWGSRGHLYGYIRKYIAIYAYIHPKICILGVWACILGVWTCILSALSDHFWWSRSPRGHSTGTWRSRCACLSILEWFGESPEIGHHFPSKFGVFSMLLFKIKPPLILNRCPAMPRHARGATGARQSGVRNRCSDPMSTRAGG